MNVLKSFPHAVLLISKNVRISNHLIHSTSRNNANKFTSMNFNAINILNNDKNELNNNDNHNDNNNEEVFLNDNGEVINDDNLQDHWKSLENRVVKRKSKKSINHTSCRSVRRGSSWDADSQSNQGY
jgi:hypothetical protein